MPRLGILGGGQLAQMMTQAAISLGVETAIFERQEDSPASRLTRYEVVGEWQDESVLARFADMCDVVTLENEFVDASVLDRLTDMGIPVYPTGQTLRRIQDKLIQKQTMQAAGVRLPGFRGVGTPDDIRQASETFGWPLVLKTRRDGYDGYGNATLRGIHDIDAAYGRLSAGGRALLVEAWVPFVRELAIMVLRTRGGDVVTYPVVETVQQNHICHVVRAPAAISPATRAAALAIGISAVEAIEGVGIFGVEMFELADGRVLFNEIAPRPHNSGHYSIEACLTSQFENHVRAVLGWSPGSPQMLAPAAVMVNVLGRYQGDAPPDVVSDALAAPRAHVHIYGKRQVRVGRKMGHVTVLDASAEAAEAVARQAADRIRF